MAHVAKIGADASSQAKAVWRKSGAGYEPVADEKKAAVDFFRRQLVGKPSWLVNEGDIGRTMLDVSVRYIRRAG